MANTKDYGSMLGAQIGTISRSLPTEKKRSVFDIVEAANSDAITLANRVEFVVSALCGAVPAEGEACGVEVPNGVFPTMEERALTVSSRIRSAGRELERLEALISDRG